MKIEFSRPADSKCFDDTAHVGSSAPGDETHYPQELATRIKRLCSEWVSQVSQMQQLDAAFAARLAACHEPRQAAELCGAWMGHRLDSAVAAQHRLLEAWMESAIAPPAVKTEPMAAHAAA